MTVKVTIQGQEEAPIKVTIPKKRGYPVKLKMRKTLEGNLMVFDHRDLDIVIMPTQMKVVAFPKGEMGSHIYDAQDRMFKYLVKRGIVDHSSKNLNPLGLTLSFPLSNQNTLFVIFSKKRLSWEMQSIAP